MIEKSQEKKLENKELFFLGVIYLMIPYTSQRRSYSPEDQSSSNWIIQAKQFSMTKTVDLL